MTARTEADPNNSPSTETNAQPAGKEQKRPIRTQQLDSALKSLESAFAAWESLGETASQASVATQQAAASTNDPEAEAKLKQTRQLFNQLRDQLEKL